jgi:hypothetical protein
VCSVIGDQLYFPFTAYSGIAPNGHRGMYTGASIGMATLRRDGFASMEAGAQKGGLTTRTVAFNGKHLFVNVVCPQGELRVAVLDESGQAIQGYSEEDCEAIRVDKTLQQVRWKGIEDLGIARGKPVKFRFSLTNGKLYSFWVSTDEFGASRGYVGAGGPGFSGVVDTVGSKLAKP